jgi:hypothetical protein
MAYLRHLIIVSSLTATLGRSQAPPAPAVHPSNGVLELSATPAPDPDTRPAGMRVEHYFPWHGIVEVTLQNISFAPAIIYENPCDLGFEVVDSTGRPAEQTDSGKQCADLRSIDSPTVVFSFSRHQLAPMQKTVYTVGLSRYFKIEPGRAYTVVVRRSRGLPKVDEAGRPLKDIEVSCSFDVPNYGITRPAHRR